MNGIAFYTIILTKASIYINFALTARSIIKIMPPYGGGTEIIMKFTRILCLMLAIVMLASLCLASCNSAQTSDNDTNGSAFGTNTEGQTEEKTESKADTEDTENSESSQSGSEETEESKSDSENNTSAEDPDEATESTSEEDTEESEETEVITDVMIGETLEAEYASEFTVAKVFSDYMVVQRNEHIRVWGFAPESENGKKVSGEFKGMFAEAIIEDGEWCITFGARLEADVNGAEMKIYTDKMTVTFTDVLVGDVYLVMGQSNANYTVNNHLTFDDPTTQGGGESAIDPDSIIRLNLLSNSGGSYPEKGTDYVYADLTNTKFWTKTTKDDTTRFSAIGYYFARHMTEKDPTVPIGLMQVAVGGAPIVSFLPNDLADKWDGDYLDQTSGLYLSNVNAEHKGRYFYNCYLAPVSKYAIAGVVWYQGESNNHISEAMKYNATFADFINRLRSTHNLVNKKFPVFITELPSIYQKPASHTGDWHFMELGMIRAYMGSIPTVLDNSYVAVSCDLWSDRTFYNSLHPNCKYEQAARLADIADVVINKRGTLDAATGPIFESATVSADKKTVVITFSNVGEGLATADGGNAVLGIIGLADETMGHSVVNPVSATITGKDQITVVFNSEVKAVGYNYLSSDFYGETINLCNSSGCPAAAFLSEYKDKEIGTYEAKNIVPTSNKKIKFNRQAIDSLQANGHNLFTVGKVAAELSAAGNRVEVTSGTSKISAAGWIGFGYKILRFGYSVDGEAAVFSAYPVFAGEAVINAGGEFAKRFTVSVPISKLSEGTHTVDIVALIDLNDGVAVKFLSFTLEITAPPVIPEGLDVPAFNASGYGFRASAFDLLAKDGTEIFKGQVANKLAAVNNTVTVKKGVQNIRMYGWIGYNTTIDKLGYAIDGVAVIESSSNPSEQAVKDAGGENARRFDVKANISGLEAGYHTVDLLVRINMPDGSTAVLKILSFTLIIEE